MNSIRSRFVPVALALTVGLSAQEGDPARGAFGVGVVGGVVRAGGPDYSARFDEHGVEFVPALGRRAEKAMPVRFTLESVRRGDGVGAACAAGVAPVVDGNRVLFARDSGLTEVYDARADGIEQSFVFATRPAGSGDLVVRGSITTELPLVAASDDGIRYELPGLGGVSFGAVTGIDANGATARGSIRVLGDGRHVEWALPAAFVETAAYPLVLDPLIGSAFQVGDAPGIDLRPAVAFDVSSGRYLVAWTLVVAANQGELRGQLVTSTGALTGSLITITTNANPDNAPAVVSCNAMNRFLVMWRTPVLQVSSVYCATVNPTTGVVSPSTLIDGGSGGTYRFDVGGDLRTVGDKCLVVSSQSSWFGFQGVLVTVPSTGAPILGTPFQIANVTPGSAAVTKSAGTAGRWIVAWTQTTTAPGVYRDVRCVAVSEAGTLCSSVTTVALGITGADVKNVDVATKDGNDFVVAWQDDVLGRVRLRPGTVTGLCPGTLSFGNIVNAVTTTGAQSYPGIDFAKDHYLLTWSEVVSGTGQRVFVKNVDPAVCGTCGPNIALEAFSGTQDQPAVGSRWSGGDTASNEGLVTWSTGTIRGRRVASHDAVENVGGRCGTAGFSDFATYDGDAVIGSTNFQLVLAAPTAPAIAMIVGLSAISVPCGPCTIVPALDILLGGGSPASLFLPPDPTLVGVDIWTQWLILKPGGCPIIPDFAFSDALRFTIGE